MDHLTGDDDDPKTFNPKDDDFATCAPMAKAGLEVCEPIQQSIQPELGIDSSYDPPASLQESSLQVVGDESDILESEIHWTAINDKKSQDGNDPGPSVRRRTPAELEAIMETQVEHPILAHLDAKTLLPLLSSFQTAFEKRIRDMHPERTELDWLGGQPRALKSTPSRRAAQAQLCGVQGPQAEACHSCLGGKGPFQNCRISFVEGHVQWSWACINCVFRSNSRGCSFRPDRSLNVPSWVGDAVAQHEPYNNMLSVYRAGKEVTQLLSLPDVKNQGPAEATATADGRSQKRDDASASATHVSGRLKNGGLSFNDTWYRSPLEDPNVYQMEKNKKEFVLATYYDVAQILERVKEDHQRMKVALIDKGFLAPSDDEDEDEGMEVEESVVAQ